MYTVTNNILTIGVDTDFIAHSVNVLKESIIHNNMFKGTKLSRAEMLEQLDNVNKAINLVMQLGTKIFDLLPVTKAGLFSKTGSILIYDTGICDTDTYDGFVRKDTLQLRLLTNADTFSCDYVKPMFLKNPSIQPVNVPLTLFNGHYGQIVLTFKSGFNKEDSLITKDGKVEKVEPKKRNSYIKTKDLKYGYVYKDAKDIRWIVLFGFAYNSSIQKFYLLRMTKKNEKIVSNCTTISQLSQILLDDCNGNMDSFASKCIEKPKFVKEEGKALTFDMSSHMSFNHKGKPVYVAHNLIMQEYLK